MRSMAERKMTAPGARTVAPKASPQRPVPAAAGAAAPAVDAASETHLQLLRLLEDNPELSQRELAHELGVSVGKINYCVSALLAKGWIKARNFKNSRNKLSYAYLLTPSGIEQKAALTVNFLRRKLDEYAQLHREIAQLRAEAGGAAALGEDADGSRAGNTPRRRSTDVLAGRAK